MTDIRLYNTRTRRKETFEPLDPANVRMYVCGPTVYDRAHLGNARPVVTFDVLFRLLRHVYGEDHVTYVRNFTDVDDKINAAARAMKDAGDPRSLVELIRERTDRTIGWYHADMDALGALRPSIRGEVTTKAEPRATEWIGAMISMIQGLLDRKNEDGVPFAYVEQGHVLFRVRAYKNYGALSGRSVDDMIAGARVEVAPFKEDPMDFVLWKPSDAELPGWDSPWGRGRPGWHIECSAMAHELLGESFDIHGGGIDLQFPHHENEIAQSCCAHPEGDFARVWMHNEMLQVEGKKMSKSLGNFFTVHQLLEQGIPGEVIRFVFLSTHYRKPMDWTAEKAREARGHLAAWHRLKRHALSEPDRKFTGKGVDPQVVEALADDLNTPLVFQRRLFELAKEAKLSFVDSPAVECFFETLAFLGFENLDVRRLELNESFKRASDIVELIQCKVAEIEAARATRDFETSDRIREGLKAAGVLVQISKDGVSWERGLDFDPAKLEALE
ncbi:MAG: cysteine--tRNA ligase [Rhodobacteraceae bacterium]|nr:cysteine--tRNA ligase [Paracoccaceae bacterium]